MAHRIEKINSLIKEQLADIILTKIDREHFKLITITRVLTSKDLSSTKVYLSLHGQQFQAFAIWVKDHIYHIQGELNHRLSLHRVPRITFLEDTTNAYVDHIEQLLKSISK
jgi:ribosome-binding factor A